MNRNTIIKVGHYKLKRKGSRVVISRPGFVEFGVRQQDRIEIAFTLATALELVRLPKKLAANKRRLSVIKATIQRLLKEQDELQDGERFRGYNIRLTRSGKLQFGCTGLTSAKLAEIKKLLLCQ